MAKRIKKELTYKQRMGKDSKIKGLVNENRSIQHILAHYEIYGVPDRSHINFTPRGSKHHMDLFSTKYFDRAGNVCFAGFDICTITDNWNPNFPVATLIQVKSTRLPTKRYLDVLCKFPVGGSIRKELHLWVGDTLHKYPLDGSVDFSKIKLI